MTSKFRWCCKTPKNPKLFGVQYLDEFSGDLKSRLFEGQISSGTFFKGSGFSYGYCFSPNHLKTRPFKIRRFCTDFKWFLTKWLPYVWISNHWASGFQILWNPDHLQLNHVSTIQNLDSGFQIPKRTLEHWAAVSCSSTGYMSHHLYANPKSHAPPMHRYHSRPSLPVTISPF